MSVTIEQVVQKYIELRDEVDSIEAECAQRTAAARSTMKTLEAWVQAQINATGVQSFKTSAGIAYQDVVTSCKVSNGDALLDFVRENGLWHLLTKSVSKTAIAEYLKEEGSLPPGVDWSEIRVVKFRRSK